ncbi:MAG: DeoR/GlpR transcriptional regulator [Spirochaetales bacterium]|nr:DeoR/GlpR transcriptional regulator [Spirochaetales bacterium]
MKKDFVEERRSKILEYVNSQGRADISELSSVLKTAEATIRRDLATLEKDNLIYRVHGGVIKREQPSIWQTTALQDRLGMNSERKERIAKFVTQLVHDGDSLMIDGGSTTMLAAKALCTKKNLLVVSNAPPIGELLINYNDNKVILTGGELLKETSAMIGNAAQHSLEQYRTDKAIIGVSGLLADEGCFAAVPQEAEIKRLMSFNSRETIVITDSSKIGVRAFCFVCDFTHVDKLVTDKDISSEALENLKQQDVEVYIV